MWIHWFGYFLVVVFATGCAHKVAKEAADAAVVPEPLVANDQDAMPAQLTASDISIVENDSDSDVQLFSAPMHEPLIRVSNANQSSSPLSFDLGMRVNGKPSPTSQQVKDPLVVSITSAVDSLVFCYYLDPDDNLMRIYPNRFSPDSRIAAGQTIQIPSSNEWSIEASLPGFVDEFMCLAIDPALDAKLTGFESVPDLEPLATNNFNDVVNKLQTVTGTPVHAERVLINVTQ